MEFPTALTIIETDPPRNLDPIGLLFKGGNPYTKLVQFLRKFSDKSIIRPNGPFGKGLCHDLCHFITGHGALPRKRTIRVCLKDAGT